MTLLMNAMQIMVTKKSICAYFKEHNQKKDYVPSKLIGF